MHFALNKAAVHWGWVTAHLYEEQTFIGVSWVTAHLYEEQILIGNNAEAQTCCHPVWHGSTG